MRFADPLWLFCAVPVAAAGLWAFLRLEPRRAALAFPDGAALAAAARSWNRLWAALPYALKTSALLLIVVAMARPQIVEREFRSLSRGIDILIVLDTSDSMKAIDFDPMNRIGAARETAKRFILGRMNDRIGLLVFGGAPVMACPLTMDYAALLDYLEGVDAGMTQTNGTAIGDAVVSAVDHLKSSQAKSKVVILLTDGANNTGAVDPVTAAKTAAAYGVKIYAIGTAKRGPAMVPVDTPMGRTLQQIPDELDEDALTQVAEATGGKYFRATSYKELAEVYREIDRLEKTETTKPPIFAYHDLYRWWVWPAAGLLLLDLALSRTVLLRIP